MQRARCERTTAHERGAVPCEATAREDPRASLDGRCIKQHLQHGCLRAWFLIETPEECGELTEDAADNEQIQVVCGRSKEQLEALMLYALRGGRLYVSTNIAQDLQDNLWVCAERRIRATIGVKRL